MISTSERPRVLVVEDDRAVRESLRRSLEFNGYAVRLAADGGRGARRDRPRVDPAVVVMDVMMPRLDGLEATLCAARRRQRRAAAGAHTRATRSANRVAGLDAGADDYLTKPFALQELLARLRALMRRTVPHDPEVDEVLEFSDLTMNLATRGGPAAVGAAST